MNSPHRIAKCGVSELSNKPQEYKQQAKEKARQIYANTFAQPKIEEHSSSKISRPCGMIIL